MNPAPSIYSKMYHIQEHNAGLVEYTRKYTSIPWKKMAGMRDKLIHEYFGIDVEILWETIKKDLPELLPKIKKLLNDTNQTVT